MIQTLIIENQALVRCGLRALVGGLGDFHVVADVSDGEQALNIARRDRIDLVVMEWLLPGMGGLETIARLRKLPRKPRILITSSALEDPFPTRLFETGASGVISKYCDSEELRRAITAVSSGGRYVSPDVAQRVAQSLFPARSGKSPFDELSKRELQVMLMAIRGLKVQDMSSELCLSPKTVSTYRYRMFEKLGVKCEVELTHLALRYGMLTNAPAPAAASAAH